MVADSAEKPSYSLSCSQPFLRFKNRNRHTIFFIPVPKGTCISEMLNSKLLGGARIISNAKDAIKIAIAFYNREK